MLFHIHTKFDRDVIKYRKHAVYDVLPAIACRPERSRIMRITLCRWGSAMEKGVKRGLNALGISCSDFRREISDYDTDRAYMDALSEHLLANRDSDLVMSVNYIPVVAMVCKAHKIPYISWVVDCPCLTLYSSTVSYPTNFIFLFDRQQYAKFEAENPGHIFHLPLAFDPAVARDLSLSDADRKKYGCDISFVGALYRKRCQYDEVAGKLPDYIRGYVEGLIASQKNVFGYNLLADSIDEKWAYEFMKYADFQVLDNYRKDYREFIADYFIGYKCTQEERIGIMRSVSELGKTCLFTTDDTKEFPEINNCGIADTFAVMPKVFALSRINLNITLRSISSGIPLRCFDIMGTGGFLLSNYQPELAEHFIDGEELVMYSSMSDLLDKVSYYLEHEDERRTIAAAGQKKVLSEFTFEKQLSRMFEMLG